MPIIEVNSLSKTFEMKVKNPDKKGLFKSEKKSVEAVKNVNFQIEKGEIIGFIGPNGAGKSTTIKMMTGIIYPTSGSIKVLGLDPTKNRKKLAYKIGCMFGQKSQLWMHLPALDSYKLLGAMYDIPDQELNKRIAELTELFDIKDLLNIPVRKLSLGQRMICEICAIMLHNPEIIFLDEPTIGLDIVVKQKVRELIETINKEKNTTIFLTSHDIGDVEKLCERVIIIDKGTVIKDKAISELKTDKALEDIIYDIYTNKKG